MMNQSDNHENNEKNLAENKLDSDTLQELKTLLDAMCDQSINEEQSARLEVLIASDESALEFYVQYIWMNAGLERHLNKLNPKIDTAQFKPKLAGALQTDINAETHKENNMATLAANAHQEATHDRAMASPRSKPAKNRAIYWSIAILLLLAVSTGVLMMAMPNGDGPGAPGKTPHVAQTQTPSRGNQSPLASKEDKKGEDGKNKYQLEKKTGQTGGAGRRAGKTERKG